MATVWDNVKKETGSGELVFAATHYSEKINFVHKFNFDEFSSKWRFKFRVQNFQLLKTSPNQSMFGQAKKRNSSVVWRQAHED